MKSHLPTPAWFILILGLGFGCGPQEPDAADKRIQPRYVAEADAAAGTSENPADAEGTGGGDDAPVDPPPSEPSDDVEPTGTPEDPTTGDEDVADDPPTERIPCETPAEGLPPTFTLASITELLNALPKPVTIPCLIDVLPRPLALNATTSDLSVQPAMGLTSPRIFLRIDDLILTFALEGEGARTVEFSQLIGDDTSVKGELPFPVENALPPEAPFAQVQRDGVAGTRCAACHFDEEPAGASFPAGAFVSRALRPFARQDVPLYTLEQLAERCGDATDLRCESLRAFFDEVPPEAFTFPGEMPTLF